MSNVLPVRTMYLGMLVAKHPVLAKSHKTVSCERVSCVTGVNLFVDTVSIFADNRLIPQNEELYKDNLSTQHNESIMENDNTVTSGAIILKLLSLVAPKTVYDLMKDLIYTSSGSRFNWSFLDILDYPNDATWLSYNSGNPSVAEAVIDKDVGMSKVIILDILRCFVKPSSKYPSVTILRPYLFLKCRKPADVYTENFSITINRTQHQWLLHEQNKNQTTIRDKHDKGYYIERKGVT